MSLCSVKFYDETAIMGRKTYVVFGDAVKCCDKLWLKDCLLEMRSAGCNLQDLQLIYQLNSETEITV